MATYNLLRRGSYSTMIVSLVISIITILSIAFPVSSQEQQEVYGTQCSFAITGMSLDGCDPTILDERQKFYDHYMERCYHHSSKQDCLENERGRLDMNLRQPQSMVNMTETGYLKLKAPDSLLNLLTNFWETNKDQKYLETWEEGNVFTNNWDSPSYMVSIEDSNLEGGGEDLKQAVWDAAIDGIAQWTGGVAKLRPVSLYGIREYTEGSVLSPHVDRIPLVSSGIVNVAQDVDEPWPLEVYDRNGKAVNITMEPGDMVLYESHSLIHGRPFPLKGRSFANVFIHFEPHEGWDETKQGADNSLPPYILPGSPWEREFKKEYPNGWFKDFAEGEEPPVNAYAADGDLEKLQEAAAIDVRLLWFQDSNGWAPIHEAVRGGHFRIVRYLVENGADVNALTVGDISPLTIATSSLGPHHKITKYLKRLGAESHGDFGESNEEAAGDDDYFEYDDDGVKKFIAEEEAKAEEEDNVPTIVTLEKEILDKVPEIVPTMVTLEKEILDKVPEIVPTIVAADDDEEL